MNGLVLAGGQSTRMGKDKALIDYHGQPQFLHIYKLLENYCDQVFISSKENKYSLPTLIDSPELEALGPIAGIISAFEYEDNDWLVIAIDYPLFSKEHILKLIEPTDTLANVYFNPVTGFFEPFLALYKQTFKETLMSEISTGTNSLQTILRKSLVTKVIPKNLEVIKSIDYPEQP
ncbi:MAG: molybdenum cofactor guanylyltransferase [Chitinophagales bacterium]|jgi:molybdopterin-guanine dinucleotide biosynthesis protein A|nr:molybdenum cofactor guanylyltransferase [Sphingobacteriales bacterium]